MKQVWQTEDGGLFDTEQEAQEWEERGVHMNNLEEFVWASTSGVPRVEIREILEALLAHYNVTPK